LSTNRLYSPALLPVKKYTFAREISYKKKT